MNFIRQLTGLFSGKSGASGDDVGMYYYVRCNRCKEVIRVRINPMNDLSATDNNDGWFVHKTIVGKRCYNRIEATFNYNKDRKLVDTEITGGTLVDQAAYDADQASQPAAEKTN
ncbi:MAG: hypothetical protein IT324_05155 [Anaerolineae bacterium]|nr:hypothetical protein [Anaerolineae bacterium]